MTIELLQNPKHSPRSHIRVSIFRILSPTYRYHRRGMRNLKPAYLTA